MYSDFILYDIDRDAWVQPIRDALLWAPVGFGTSPFLTSVFNTERNLVNSFETEVGPTACTDAKLELRSVFDGVRICDLHSVALLHRKQKPRFLRRSGCIDLAYLAVQVTRVGLD